ncbi:MAG: GMC family oxidoreductase N-terminal domain-containing protein [Proteobacteria bacterium]|nr:GMC family oxidoreductase N-terminal domain-containing protein [Burkholderiales bacterium]
MARAADTLVVIGAGAGGCVLATRLAQRTRARVVLLEAGGHAWSPLLKVPMAVGKALREGWHGWHYQTEPIAGADGRSVIWPRGKVVGGSTSINGMIYVRGAAADFDAWADAGNEGWRHADVLPYFKRAEHHLDRHDAHHGNEGPWVVARATDPNPLYDAFVEAGVAAGFAHNDDFNGAVQEGFGRYDFCIDRGLRSSTATAYLPLARRCANFELITRAHATRLLLDGTTVTGVEYATAGRRERIEASEVFLCGGVVNSPQLLQLSGIGEPADLEPHGIAVRHALPGVGRGLTDHVQLPIRFTCNRPLTVYTQIRADRMLGAMAQAMFAGSGPATRFPVEGGAFTRASPQSPAADLQWFFVRSLGVARLRGFGRSNDPLMQEGFTIALCMLQPNSRGRIGLRSADPLSKPVISPGWLDHPSEVDVFLAGMEQVARVADAAPLRQFIGACLTAELTDKDRATRERYVRRNTGPGHHQVGTCRMGHDAHAVVDAQLRVRGLDRLRIVDASVMPNIVRGNTAAATVMIAEKCADLVAPS